MKVCFPAITHAGMETTIYGHFASAPLFVIADTESGEIKGVDNCDPANPFGGCNPFSALRGERLDGIVVGGIGDESVRVMNMCGFRIFQAKSAALSENLALFQDKALEEVVVQESHLEGRCSGGSGNGCNHHH